MRIIQRGRHSIAVLVVSLILLVPITARAGLTDIITIINTITSTIENTIGTALAAMQTLDASLNDFRQQVLFPLTLINRAKAFVGQVRAQFTSLTGQIHAIEISSATLPNPQQLEAVLRHGQSGDMNQVATGFYKVFTPVPLPSDAAPADRDLVDVDDAMAMSSIKLGMISDQATQQMLGVADGIERAAATAAPGSAPLLTVQAEVANLQNQAMLQRVLASELRQAAARLAHNNSLRKRSSAATRQLRDHMQQILSRP